MKDYSLTCGEVLDNLLMLADAYEKASAGKAPNGFAFNPTDAAANMKAAVHFIGSFGQQLPRWIPVEERLPPDNVAVLVNHESTGVEMAFRQDGQWGISWTNHMHSGCAYTHWMPLPAPPEAK